MKIVKLLVLNESVDMEDVLKSWLVMEEVIEVNNSITAVVIIVS